MKKTVQKTKLLPGLSTSIRDMRVPLITVTTRKVVDMTTGIALEEM